MRKDGVLVRILMDGKIERASAISDAMELGCSALMVGYDLKYYDV